MEICFLFFRVSVIVVVVAAATFFRRVIGLLEKKKLFSFFWNGKFEVNQHKLYFGVIDNFLYLSFWLNHYVHVSACLYSCMCVTYITVQKKKKIKPVRLTLAAQKVFFFSSDFAPFFHSFRTFSNLLRSKYHNA